MAKHDRHYLGDGVAIQRRGEVWWLDVYRQGERFRHSLATRDKGKAVMMAGSVLTMIKDQERKIHELAERIPSLRQKLQSILISKPTVFLEPIQGPVEQGAPPLNKITHHGCMPAWVESIIGSYEGTMIDRLRDLALEGTNVNDLLRTAVREEVTGILDQRRPASPAAIAWEAAFQKFEKSKTGKVKPETLKNILRDVRQFIAFAKVPHVGDATSALVDEWVSALQAEGSSPKTAWNKRVSLSSFFKWAQKVQKIIPANPVSDTEPPKVDAKDPEYLTRDQFTQRMERIKGKPWEWVVGLSALGLRLGEITRLDPERDIDIPGRNIRVRNTDEGSVKTGKPRNVVILDQMLRYVMMVPKEGFSWNDKEISKVTCALGVGNLLVRHTTETHLRLNGVLPQAVGDFWLGHDGRTGGKNYAGWWRPSEPPMELTYFGLPLLPHGIPQVTPEVRKAYKA